MDDTTKPEKQEEIKKDKTQDSTSANQQSK